MTKRRKFLDLGYRIWPGQWRTDEQFSVLREFLLENISLEDELWLFDIDEVYAEQVQLKEVYSIMKERIKILHKDGFKSVGINVLNTLGHGPATIQKNSIPFQKAVDFNGSEAAMGVCPNNKEFREYIKRKYKLAAEAEPDFIYVDDDFRMANRGVKYSCFCQDCLSNFGFESEREELVARLNQKENVDLRKEWNQFVTTSLISLAADIRKCIDEVNSDIETGLMIIGYSRSTYGRAPEKMMEALEANRCRPGHGFYNDKNPEEILNKVLDVGRVVKDLPENTDIIQYELENYPYINLAKSVKTQLNECKLALFAGCTGIAFNVLRTDAGPLDEFTNITEGVDRERKLLKDIIKLSRETSLCGVWPAASKNLMVEKELKEENNWFSDADSFNLNRSNELMTIGIPFTSFQEKASAITLSGNIASGFSKTELREMLQKGIYLDTKSLKILWEKGLGELTGIKPGPGVSRAHSERFTDHELNGNFQGEGRHVGFMNRQESCKLLPLNENVIELSHFVDSDGFNLGNCFSLYENELGGRVAVSSFASWNFLGTKARRKQLLHVFDWLSERKLPVFIEDNCKVAPFVRKSQDNRKILVGLFNMSFDKVIDLRIRLRFEVNRVFELSAEEKSVLNSSIENDETKITVPEIKPWSIVVLMAGEKNT